MPFACKYCQAYGQYSMQWSDNCVRNFSLTLLSLLKTQQKIHFSLHSIRWQPSVESVQASLTRWTPIATGLPLPRDEGDNSTPHSPVLFLDENFRAPPTIAVFIFFSADEKEDSMIISALEKNWAESEWDRLTLRALPASQG
ncbi:hypothetical protein DPX16_0258 [Anabarilius grahami]|uniref:Uncharacterized protein n=1 Tax=Anabarilius grahami TaxID=495550 RepID=A0A3N0XUI7_ANAGA|nr:hypothetical protein DPX16_0258 [Anabarilius grahami]